MEPTVRFIAPMLGVLCGFLIIASVRWWLDSALRRQKEVSRKYREQVDRITHLLDTQFPPTPPVKSWWFRSYETPDEFYDDLNALLFELKTNQRITPNEPKA